ncbi:MAG: Uracil-DNA glycosylase family 4 [Hyphomonadaceae bacterium]|nr:MAG: Uracil-DNA glycosylase family 4 [Hyphomonadaceae bacterium]
MDAKSASRALLDFWLENGVSVPPIEPVQRNPAPKTADKPIVKQISTAKYAAPIDGQNLAIELAKTAKTLDELRDILNDFDGCNLKKNAPQMVFSDGQIDAKIMVIGEAPGQEEAQIGKPFVGAAVKCLDEMLSSIGLSREKNVYITNTVNWRPPANRTPTRDEIAICLPFLMRHIELKAPKLLILVGGTAANAVLNSNEGITKLRKKPHKLELVGLEPIDVFCLFHPAFLLRYPVQKSLTWKDLLTIEAQIKTMGLLE